MRIYHASGSFTGSFKGNGSGLTGVGGNNPSVINTTKLTSNQNNYNPTGWSSATIVKLCGDNGFRQITGFEAGTAGQEKLLTNTGSFCLYLGPSHASSSAANRIKFHEEIILPPGESCKIYYDDDLDKWIPFNAPVRKYNVARNAVFYDMSTGEVPDPSHSGTEMDTFGSITTLTGAPTSTEPFAYYDMNTGVTTSGGAGLYYPNHIEDMAYISSAHIVAYIHMKTPSAVSDATNDYYYFLRVAANPSSGFWDQSNSFGLRYTHDVNSGKWQAYSRDNGGTDKTVDTGVTFAINTEYHLMISIDKSRSELTYWINNEVVARINTNLPSAVACGPSTQLEKTAGSSARSVKSYRFIGAAIAP